MRLLLIAAVLALGAAGCGDQRASTMLEAPPAAAPVIDRYGHEWVPPAPLVAPVYPDARPLVFLACQRAALAYFHHIDEQDAAAGRLLVHDHNAWSGDGALEVTLSDAGGGRTRVNVTAQAERAEMLMDREHQMVRNYLARLPVEMETVRSMHAMIADPAAFAAAPPTAAP